MYLTREEEWREVNLARIFSNKQRAPQVNKDRNMICNSHYLAHLGTHKEFLLKLEYYLDPLEKMIIVGDGARWIWNWAETFYPNSVQILDFYHAKEHLCNCALEYFSADEISEKERWITLMSKYLLEDRVALVVKELKGMNRADQKRKALIRYYEQNQRRMTYQTFLEKGYMIGS